MAIAQFIASAALALFAASANSTMPEAQQLVLVITEDWNSNQGELSTFDVREGRWQPHMRDVHVAIGKSGSAWGHGLHERQEGPQKREGDGRSPAGVFTIGTAFGYAASISTGLTYQAMNEFDYCIDVTDSPLYNQIVDERVVGREAVAGSTEPMRRDIHAKGDVRYALGFVIEHNRTAVRAGGSCIFAHLWGSPGQTTAGCTAMDRGVMQRLLEWLDAKKRPVFVLLPRAEYARVRNAWHLPEIAERQ